MNAAFPALQMPSPGAQLRRSFSSDLLKLRGTAALWLTLLSGAFPVALSLLIYYFKGQYLLKPGQNPWQAYVLQSWQTASGLLLPLFVVLLTSLLLNIENKASAWKHLYAQPVGRGALFASKLGLLLGLNALAQVVYAGLLAASGLLLGLLRPELHFLDHALPLGPLLVLLGHTFVATLGLLAIQFIASLWWRSFVAPVALGLGATIAALTLMRWEYISWVPYAAPLLSLRAIAHTQSALAVNGALAASEWRSLGWFAVVLTLGYGLLRRRHEA
ncbi:ABC transporter permease [Hymenobacter sp. BT730]|uniref:ABC transporter permease n=1 Tax=Hymenobacter sp. BT730 TaxID=3063332 RepID=UPI0026E0CA3E|nr:ABC transporter permease [Hymenobacter sp. BT730]